MEVYDRQFETLESILSHIRVQYMNLNYSVSRNDNY